MTDIKTWQERKQEYPMTPAEILMQAEIDQLRARIAKMEEQLKNKATHITWNEEGVRLVNGVPATLAPWAAPSNESDALLHCLKLAFPGKEISPAAMEMLYPSEAPKGAEEMTREQLLDIIKLLSALEAWSFSEKHMLPDYLLEDLDKIVGLLSAEVLK